VVGLTGNQPAAASKQTQRSHAEPLLRLIGPKSTFLYCITAADSSPEGNYVQPKESRCDSSSSRLCKSSALQCVMAIPSLDASYYVCRGEQLLLLLVTRTLSISA
jgi:hypothetical protein